MLGSKGERKRRRALRKLGTQISGRDGIQAAGGDTNLTMEKRHPSLHGTRGKGGKVQMKMRAYVYRGEFEAIVSDDFYFLSEISSESTC